MLRRAFLLTASAALVRAAHTARDDSQPFPAYRIIGNVWYVGANEIASILIATPAGHIVINSGFEETVPIIRSGVEKLGFKLGDVKYLLNGQAHIDHVGGMATLKHFTGARVVCSRGDAPVVAGGGRGDFRWEGHFAWKPCPVDRIVDDGGTVDLGGVTLTARLTPGHTKGCTTWTFPVREAEKRYEVVVVGGTTVFPEDVLVNNPKYPRIADDYIQTFRTLRALPCDVFLGAHGSYYDMQAKYAAVRKGARPNPFIDPAGYRRFVDRAEKTFLTQLAGERLGQRGSR